ncbi:hypothetical protein LTS06_012379, partial [Exophiala xenobiotica]
PSCSKKKNMKKKAIITSYTSASYCSPLLARAGCDPTRVSPGVGPRRHAIASGNEIAHEAAIKFFAAEDSKEDETGAPVRGYMLINSDDEVREADLYYKIGEDSEEDEVETELQDYVPEELLEDGDEAKMQNCKVEQPMEDDDDER